MKVLKVGNKRPKVEKPKKAKCPDCGSIIEYDSRDTHDIGNGCEFITCPICQKEICVQDYGYGRSF